MISRILYSPFWSIGQRGRHDCNGDGKYKSVKASFGRHRVTENISLWLSCGEPRGHGMGKSPYHQLPISIVNEGIGHRSHQLTIEAARNRWTLADFPATYLHDPQLDYFQIADTSSRIVRVQGIFTTVPTPA